MSSPEAAQTRRAQYSEATRTALLDAATALFDERGYAGTALADVAATARVTRGAVYHHFEDKQALFEAVLNRFEVEATQRITIAAAGGSDPWDAAMRGVDAFLDQCCEPVYGRIVWREGPLALGWQRWRECEYEYGYGLTEQFVRTLTNNGLIEPGPVATTTRLVFAMLGECGLALAEAAEQDKPQVLADCRLVVHRIIDGLRAAS
jgi:AcrR family transcriptional regulator